MKVNQKKQVKKLAKKQESLMQKESLLLPMQLKIKNKMPEKVQEGLEKAFYKSLQKISEKGIGWIEKAVHMDDKEKLGRFLQSEFQEQQSKRSLKNLQREVKKTRYHHLALTQIKSGALGLLGIGLPDIPVFLASLLSSIYAVGITYGFDYHQEQEQAYVLLLICVSCFEASQKDVWRKELEAIEEGKPCSYRRDELLLYTSKALAYEESCAKFLQGVPIAGVLGSFMSTALQARITAIAQTAYKKRFLKEGK